MRLRMIGFIIAALAVFIGLNAFIGWNGWVWWEHDIGSRGMPGYWIVFVLLVLSYLLARLGRRMLPHRVADALKIAGSYWMALFFYALLLLPVVDLAALALRLDGKPANSYVPILGAIVLAALAVLLAIGSCNAWRPVVRKYEMTIAKSAGDWRRLRMVAASDLHLGATVRKPYLQLLVRRIHELQPDLILLPGDVLDDDVEPFLRHRMAEVLSELTAPYGVWAVLGNHEYIGGGIEAYVREMERVGIRVLRDETVVVADRILLAGRKDKAVERFGGGSRLPLSELLAGADRSMPVILMDHQPSAIHEAAEAGVDLSVSGHTHRGQLAPNHLITRRIFPLDWGYAKFRQMHAVVSSGYGTWGPPIRLGSRSEIVEIELRFSFDERNEYNEGRAGHTEARSED